MKINNPTKFFPELSGEQNYLNAKHRSTIVTRGDIIKLYAKDPKLIDSEDDPSFWHLNPVPGDNWWKMSFDAGQTFPIKMKFEGNSFSTSFHVENDFTQNAISSFIINENYDELKEGNIRLFETDNQGFQIENKNFKFKFDDSTSGLIIKFMGSPITGDELSSYDVTIKTGIDAQAYGVETLIFSSTVSAIPTVYNPSYGTCNYLDSEFSSIECLTRLSNVNKIKLKVISADPLLGGNIILKFKCGSTVFTQTIAVTTEEELVDIVLPNMMSGTLIIERLYDNANDTLKDNGIVISAIITEIKVETI